MSYLLSPKWSALKSRRSGHGSRAKDHRGDVSP